MYTLNIGMDATQAQTLFDLARENGPQIEIERCYDKLTEALNSNVKEINMILRYNNTVTYFTDLGYSVGRQDEADNDSRVFLISY